MRCPAATARWFTNAPSNLDGSPVRWFTINVQYFVDPGPLSNPVSHDAAEAMVAAAAQVWNVPSASLTLQKGGLLSEDVSSSNVYLGSNGPIWPSDVQVVNYKAKNIAIIFDADGTLTDMLLGRDASEPLNCRQNAVTEIVDGFSSPTLYLPAFITHAMVFLNGRCTGPAQEQQLQMQYQLMRTFGRIIGVGWSQTNDNVFTGATQPTYLQQTHWPIMHPIDILCGPYTYQCLPDPFTLRDDDVAAVALVYPIGSGQATGLAGKEETLAHAAAIRGNATFPNGMGMSGVNMVMTRQPQYLPKEEFADTSAVSGYPMQGEAGNPVTGVSAPTVTQGSSTRSRAGSYLLNRMPLEDQYSWENFFVTMEPINPLYQGAYSVGPYHTAVVAPSGPLLAQAIYVHQRLATGTLNFTAGTQAADCTSGDSGSESAPMQIDASGTWVGRLCGYGHTAWTTMATSAGRTMTIEVTAQNETGMATPQKALPLVGLWNASDAVGILPTITWTPSALNGQLIGMTQLKSIATRTGQIRIAVAEQRGEGRPDFGYRARVLYADSVIPSRMDINGGCFRIFGSGFEIGNAVTVGGVLATVEEWSPSQIVAVAPSFVAIGKSIVNDVAVTDLKTGGQTKISGGMVMDLCLEM
jgi:hypothetical protein